MSEDSKKNNPEENLNKINEKIINSEIEHVMKKSYIDYSMSVIVGRALPDVRDGLKPVHRRILYAMNELGMFYSKPTKKSARIVGEVLGKYHPHGDVAVYDTLVRMVQDFSLRYPLIYGQGNFGSLDGDSPAAMRYTEAKMSKIADEMLDDIKKETVDMVPNFDGTLVEPSVLPSKLPNLLINGSAGIAVGMATNIPPHNLKEVCGAITYLIENPDAEITDLMEFVKGPDFPTAGIIKGKQGIYEAYKTGRGKIKVEAKTTIEERGNRQAIIIDEVPYMVNKANLVEEIANLVKDEKVEDISDIRDESDKQGVRVVIELKKDANPEVVLNQLMKHSRMRVTFGANMLSIVNGTPLVLNLKEMIEYHIEHRKEIITKRTQYDLKKAEEREHILIGLLIALEDIDRVVKKIKESKSADDAKNVLMVDYKLSEIQSKAILDMKLQKLASMEQEKIKTEREDLKKSIEGFKEILEDENKVMEIMKKEVIDLSEKYGDDRRTQIDDDEREDIEDLDLIQEENLVVTISNQGYVKSVPLETYKAQNRGGKGIIAAKSKEEDWIEQLFITNTHDYLLFFTDKGRVYWLRGYQIPSAGRQSKGRPIVNLLNMDKNEKLTTAIAIEKEKIEGSEELYLAMFTKKGIIKKTTIQNYSNPRKGGIIAINLDDDDSLVSVLLIKDEKVLIATEEGNAVKFDSTSVRDIGRTARGVRGIKLRNKDKVVNATKINGSTSILTITENGYGKRTDAEEYRETNRGGVGVINIKTTERNGKVVACFSVTDEDQIMLMSKKGITIRIPAKTISVIGRNTQGVRIMKLDEDDFVVDAKKIVLED